jgi:uncharacterized RDD family membrane protein YckC
VSNAPNTLDPFAPPAASLSPRLSTDHDLPLATRGSRFVAALLDGLVMVPLFMVGCVIAYLVMGNSLADTSQATGRAVGMMTIMYICVLPIALYQWYLIAKTGQTLGKKWMRIKIVKLDNSPVNFVSGVVLRSWVLGLANFTGGIGGFVGLIDSLAIFAADRRTLHDRIAGTKVISLG